jgi:O-antigen ligase
LAVVIFKPFLLTRATISDSAALQRVFYAKVGWQMIKANPIFGVGIGESVLHMQQYSPVKLWPWQIQPIHNYFELAAAELGIPGALILIWLFLSHLKTITYKFKTSFDAYCLLLISLLLMFLILMQFDHYFYTLQQTQMLLWVLLGIIAAESFTDPKIVVE